MTNLLTDGLSIGTVEAMDGLVLAFSREASGDANNCLLGLKDIVMKYGS